MCFKNSGLLKLNKKNKIKNKNLQLTCRPTNINLGPSLTPTSATLLLSLRIRFHQLLQLRRQLLQLVAQTLVFFYRRTSRRVVVRLFVGVLSGCLVAGDVVFLLLAAATSRSPGLLRFGVRLLPAHVPALVAEAVLQGLLSATACGDRDQFVADQPRLRLAATQQKFSSRQSKKL